MGLSQDFDFLNYIQYVNYIWHLTSSIFCNYVINPDTNMSTYICHLGAKIFPVSTIGEPFSKDLLFDALIIQKVF